MKPFLPEEHPDWIGTFSRDEAPGAWKNESTVQKSVFLPGDSTPIGTLGTVLGSLGPIPTEHGSEFGYFLEWSNAPHIAVFCRGSKLTLFKEAPCPGTQTDTSFNPASTS